MECFGVQSALDPWSPQCHTGALAPQVPAVSQWILGSMRSLSTAMLSLVPQCPTALVPRGTMVLNMFPSCHESLRSNTGTLVPRGPAVSQWPHHYTKSCSVTMLCMVPQGPAVLQWPLGSMRPPSTTMNSFVQQCHNGALVTQDPAMSPETLGSMEHHSVTIVPLVPRVLAMEQWPLISLGPRLSRGSPWSRSVPVASVVPQGPRVSQWAPCFHEALQCHSGPLVLWGPTVSQWCP